MARDALHLSVTDAVGHGAESALTATLCVGSLRNARRAGATLVEQAAAADETMRTYAADSFVTGLVGRVDLRIGILGLVNAGHEAPFLIRSAEITTLNLQINRPFGLNGDRGYHRTDL